MMVIVGLTALGGCSADGEDSAMDGEAAPVEQVTPPPTEPGATSDAVEHTGRVVVSGTGGLRMVAVFTEQGQSVGLAGALLGELTALSGAVVRVTGTAAETMGRQGVDVTRYEVVSVDGQTPVVGVLSGGGGSFRLQGDQAVNLVNVPAELSSQVGALIWVTGPETADGRRVQSYGVIRPAG